MNIKDFNEIYKRAEKINVVNDDWFKSMCWFWIGLTPKQSNKMYNLMLKQGAKEVCENGKACIKINGGILIIKK